MQFTTCLDDGMKLWCSLTSDFDVDGDMGQCPKGSPSVPEPGIDEGNNQNVCLPAIAKIF